MPKRRKGPTPRKIQIKLTLLSQSEIAGRTVILTDRGTPSPVWNVAAGPDIDMICGNAKCGNVLVHGMTVSQLKGLAFPCPQCGKYNGTLL